MLIYASPGRVAVTPWGVTVGTTPGPSAPGPFSMFGTLTGQTKPVVGTNTGLVR